MTQRETSPWEKRLGRRTFLKGTLAATAAAAGGATFLTEAPAMAETAADTPEADEFGERIYSGVCRSNCYGGCFLNVHVRDGKVVRTSARDLPEPEWNRICSKGLSHVFRIYDPDRVKYPMRRVGERGAGEWEQISWDEALSEISEKFKGYAEDYGPESVCYWKGSGNDSFADNYARLWNYLGATNISQTLDMAIFYATQKSVGVSLNFNGNEMTDLKNAKTIVIWGSNPAVSQMQGMHFIMEARDAGTKVIAVDPVYSTTVSKCDQWIPIAPGTDGLLAIAIMNIILEKGWEDESFLKASTVAPFLVKESDGKFLRSCDLGELGADESDAILVTDGNGNFGTPEQIADPVIEGTFEVNGERVTCAYTLLLDRLASYSVEEAAAQCDIPVETIYGLAEDLACNTPSTIYMLLGLDHYQNGFYSMFDICCISMLTGSAGKPGAFTGASESMFYFYDNPNNPLRLPGRRRSGQQVQRALHLHGRGPEEQELPGPALRSQGLVGSPRQPALQHVRPPVHPRLAQPNRVRGSRRHQHERDGALRRHRAARMPLVRAGRLWRDLFPEPLHRVPGEGHRAAL